MKPKEKFFQLFKFFKEELDFDFDVESFHDKIELQKLVYISEFFGFDHGYSYNRYVRGPYSPGLAEDYYALEDDDLPENFPLVKKKLQISDFSDFTDDKNYRDLELAATVLSVWKDYKEKYYGEDLREKVRDTSSNIKSRAEKSKIEAIMDEIEERNIVNFN